MSSQQLPYGLSKTMEDHVASHVPSGEWNHVVASVVWAHKDGRTYFSGSRSGSIYDSEVISLAQEVRHGEAEVKRLQDLIKKIKEEVKTFTLSTSDSDSQDEEEEEEEVVELPDSKGFVPREKSGKSPKWLQRMASKKEKAQQALKRKSLLSSLTNHTSALAEVEASLGKAKISLEKKEKLQSWNLRLQDALKTAEASYKRTLDLETLNKGIHYRMSVYMEKTAPYKDPIPLVPRLVGSPGSFRTVMVPEYYTPITPLEEYLREDW